MRDGLAALTAPGTGDIERKNAMSTVNLNGTPTDFDAATIIMDHEICERLHDLIAPCSAQEFTDAYVVEHARKFDGEEFTV